MGEKPPSGGGGRGEKGWWKSDFQASFFTAPILYRISLPPNRPEKKWPGQCELLHLQKKGEEKRNKSNGKKKEKEKEKRMGKLKKLDKVC